MPCNCKEGAGCIECSDVTSDSWWSLVRNRQLDELEGDMARFKHKYYCEGSPEVSDSQYDSYEEVLKRERPDSWILTSVGCPICGGSYGAV